MIISINIYHHDHFCSDAGSILCNFKWVQKFWCPNHPRHLRGANQLANWGYAAYGHTQMIVINHYNHS